MSHLERVSDGPDEPRSNTAWIVMVALLVVVVAGVLLFLGLGYMGGTRTINVQPQVPTQMMAPAQGAPGASGAAGAAGAAGAGGTGGAGGAAGAPGAPGAAGAAGTPATTTP